MLSGRLFALVHVPAAFPAKISPHTTYTHAPLDAMQSCPSDKEVAALVAGSPAAYPAGVLAAIDRNPEVSDFLTELLRRPAKARAYLTANCAQYAVTDKAALQAAEDWLQLQVMVDGKNAPVCADAFGAYNGFYLCASWSMHLSHSITCFALARHAIDSATRQHCIAARYGGGSHQTSLHVCCGSACLASTAAAHTTTLRHTRAAAHAIAHHHNLMSPTPLTTKSQAPECNQSPSFLQS